MSARPLRVVDASRPLEVRDAIADALAGGAPVLPRSGAASAGGSRPAPAALSLGGEWPGDACLVIETSGSTATPKRVVLTATSLRASAAATAARLSGAPQAGDSGGDGARCFGHAQWMLCLPAEYVAGAQVLARSIMAETEPVVSTPGPFDALRFAADVDRMHEGLRRTSIVPAQLGRLLDAAEGVGVAGGAGGAGGDEAARVRAAVASLDAVLVGGQSTPLALRERAARLGWRLVTTYGASETSGGCVYDGVPLDGVEARVVDGEVQLSGEVLAAGYLGDPERTAQAFVCDGGRRWYRTGDGGTVEVRAKVACAEGERAEGERTDGAGAGDAGVGDVRAGPVRAGDGSGEQRISIAGRLDNVIISGGEKVSLDRVERLVREVAGYEESVVVGVPSAEWGEVPAVVLAGPAALTHPEAPSGRTGVCVDAPEALAADPGWKVVRAAAEAAGRAARPAHRIRLATMPRLVSGKPDRREVTDLARRALAEGA
ncbi:hypothetical protein GCM10011490_16920 [Pseudoclavibacter endophyticus]|nr:AMP-binding protein [Pseudoclavibacter endophyticus]GGA66877.1 hypothetical protein GCM10011490_16920 [Pseudoclavibacter endophyticus]